MYEFTKDCMIGIKQIDDEHRKLFSMLNAAIALIDETDDTEKIYKNLIKKLRDYAATHFSHEEAYMKEINDPELPTQIKEHQAFNRVGGDFFFFLIKSPTSHTTVRTVPYTAVQPT